MGHIQKYTGTLILMLLVYGLFWVTHLDSHTQSHYRVLGATANLTLYEEPQNGRQPLLSAIDTAQKEIDMTMYLLSDKDIISHLLQAHDRNVTVNVILEEHPFGGGTTNETSRKKLEADGVHVLEANPSYALTHEKTVIIDNQEVFILSQNLTTASFEKNREYNVLDYNPQDITEIKALFNADWQRQNFTPHDPHLIISPYSSRSGLITLIKQATKQIQIEMEVIDDPEIISLLKDKAKTVSVTIILPTTKQVPANASYISDHTANGVHIKTVSHPYMHAKLMIIDEQTAYVGSVNFTHQSIDDNREVGIIITQPDIVNELENDFTTDWGN